MTLKWAAVDGWDQVAFGRLFRKVERPVPQDAAMVTAYSDGVVTLRSNRDKIGYHEAAEMSAHQGVYPGDLVVHGLDIMRGSVGVSDSAGAISSVCTVCVPLGPSLPAFVSYVVRAQAATGYTKALARGVRDGGADFRRWSTLAELPIPVPPVSTQKNIVEFLDRETAQIDNLIAKQERLFDLLGERQNELIHHTVSNGIRKKVNTDWTGDSPISTPEPRDSGKLLFPDFTNRTLGWKDSPVRSFLRLESTTVGDKWSETQLLSLTKRGIIPRDIESGIGKYPTSFEGYQMVYAGDLVFCLFDVEETPRTIGMAKQTVMITNAYTRYVPDRRQVNSHYLEWLFLSFDLEKKFKPFYSGLRNTIPKQVLGSTRVSLPPLEEQRKISFYLEEKIGQIELLRSKAKEAIFYLRERRQALISAAVTGKFEVAA